ncbi:hypothetical protein DOTSEDRAFT_57577 [Dothistroma septosporum NZE10]|uniref:C2H2-type domain-containing protein n=1 Tax=Dothistroma septosporum (strain NZE10 / CBS 128990) TaxID=675120 RepID=N1PEC3_DOTSN|nr:hypothetical protein DOTSEDRAFT_57577 [Dothistroma septosporum NZE10]
MNANRRSGVTSERDIDTLMRQSLVGTQLQSSQTVFEALDDLFRHSPEDSAPPQPNKRPASVTSRGEQAKRAKVNDLPSEEALDVFVANTETGKYEVVCSICNERLSFSRPTPYYLNRHKKIHKDRAFSCDQCGEKFTRYDLLDRHRDVHDKENYKSCSGCHRRFRDNSALHVHLEAESNRACHDAHYSPGQTGQSLQALPRDAPVVLKYSSNKREPQALPDE